MAADTTCILERAGGGLSHAGQQLLSAQLLPAVAATEAAASDELTDRLISSITGSQMADLFKRFELDFLAFDYEFESYFELPRRGSVKFETIKI